MNGITKFIDRVSVSEQRGGRDIVLSMEDARLLRDEIAKLLMDYKVLSARANQDTTLEFVGGKW